MRHAGQKDLYIHENIFAALIGLFNFPPKIQIERELNSPVLQEASGRQDGFHLNFISHWPVNHSLRSYPFGDSLDSRLHVKINPTTVAPGD